MWSVQTLCERLSSLAGEGTDLGLSVRVRFKREQSSGEGLFLVILTTAKLRKSGVMDGLSERKLSLRSHCQSTIL